MEIFGWALWVVVGGLFGWMFIHYGLGHGKERDVAQEYERKEEVKNETNAKSRDQQAS